MIGKKLIYGFNDKENAIPCVVDNITFKGTGIIITAKCDGGTINAPIEMFKKVD